MSVFERFTEGALRAIMLAQEEARRLGHNYVGTEQILLGLIGEGSGIAARALNTCGATLKEARVLVETEIGRGKGTPWYLRWLDPFESMPLTPKAKKILEFSMEESRRLKQNYIGTEHLLLGLIREAEVSKETGEKLGVAMQILQALAIDLNALKEEVQKTIE